MPNKSKIDDTELNPMLCSQALAVCACSNLRAAARVVTKLFDDALAPIGLRATQLVILLAIVEKQGQTIAGLAGRLQLDASTLNRNLRVLKSRGLTMSRLLAGQRKSLSVSSRGIQIVKQAIPIWEQTQTSLVQRFGKKRFQEMLDNLSEITELARR